MNQITRTKGVAGSSVVFQAQRRGENNDWVPDADTFTEEQALTCTVWAGKDRQGVGDLPCEWVDATAGTLQVDFPQAFMANIEAGSYLATVRLADESAELVIFTLVVENGPGLAEAPATYITFAELMEEFPVPESWIDTDQSGFAALRAKARQWVDTLILSHFTGCSASPYSFPEYNPSLPGNNVWLSDALNGGALMLNTANGARLREAQVYWVLAKVLRRAVGRSSASADLADLADVYERKADSLIQTSVAEIDTDGDGVANYVVSFRTTVTRRGW